jgi:hypothetical protein
MKWLLLVLLLAALMFFLYRYDRKNKPTKFPRKDLLLGYDFISKGSHWYPSSVTKGAEEKLLRVAGESHDQDAPDKIFRPRTDEGVEKKAKETGENPLKVVEESHDRDALDKIFRPRTDEGVEKKTKETRENPLRVVEESHDRDALDKIFRPRTDKGVEKKNVVTILVEDDNSEG